MRKLFRSMVAGTLAGALGTLSMDLLWFRRYRSGGGTEPFIAWESSEGLDGYADAPAPARTAQAVAEMAGVELPDSSARLVNNLVHWMTGLSWGQGHGVAATVVGSSNPVLGLGTAVVAWATSYVVLPRLGIYKPMSEYDSDVLWQDLSAHLVYGTALGIAFRLLSSED